MLWKGGPIYFERINTNREKKKRQRDLEWKKGVVVYQLDKMIISNMK